jgi:hypothetical protein
LQKKAVALIHHGQEHDGSKVEPVLLVCGKSELDGLAGLVIGL